MVDPEHMLGVTRVMSELPDGTKIMRLTQIAYVEQVWAEFGHFASVARSAGLHPLRISLYARAAGSRDATVFSVTLQYIPILIQYLQ